MASFYEGELHMTSGSKSQTSVRIHRSI